MRRILHVTSGGITGSLARNAYNLSVGLSNRFESCFLCDGKFYTDSPAFRDGFSRDKGPAVRSPTFQQMSAVRRRISGLRKDFDILLFHSQRYYLFASDPRKDIIIVPDVFPYGLGRVKPSLWLGEWVGIDKLIRNVALAYNLYRFRSGRFKMVSHSDFTKSELVRIVGIDPANVSVIPYPVPTNHGLTSYPPDFSKRECRTALGLPEESMIVLSIGADLPRKNMAALYYLINHLKANTLVVRVGPLNLARIKGESRPHVKHIPIASDHDLMRLYRAADVLYFPSFAEGFGVPLLEAMQMGLPVVSSTSTSIPEVLGDAGLLSPPSDYVALTRCVEEILASPETQERLRRCGYARASMLSLERSIREFGDIFEAQLLGDGSRSVGKSNSSPWVFG